MELQDLMLQAWDEYKLTMLMVTHDIEEAIYMSGRIAAMMRRPASVAVTLDIDLPRPRDQLATRALPRFLELRQYLYGLVRQKAPEFRQ
jgi:NitT/TauT family transport system ATP-binding protein